MDIKPLPEPMLAYCQLDNWEHLWVKFDSKHKNSLPRKCIWKCLQNVNHFVQASHDKLNEQRVHWYTLIVIRSFNHIYLLLIVSWSCQKGHKKLFYQSMLYFCMFYQLWCKAVWKPSLVMACCLTTPIHYLNHGSLIISEVLWHSHDGNFTGNPQNIWSWYELENYHLQITAASPQGPMS